MAKGLKAKQTNVFYSSGKENSLPKVLLSTCQDYRTRFFMDEYTKKKLLMARQLLKENAPVIYQIFVAHKHIKNTPKVVDEVYKAVQDGIQPQSVVETNQ